jgi:transglutaminase-like putative cysteine protease
VLAFAMSFALATDYGIFLLSRIKELHDAGASDADAVADGLERTGPVVTAAALLLCIALGSLLTARHALVKEVGFGAALTVALDATIVRVMLIPALMRLLGRWNWWAPAPLRRLRARAAPLEPRPVVAAEPRLRPGDPRPVTPAQALMVTRFCDHEHPAIHDALARVRADAAPGEESLAVAAFDFVRDHVRYAFEPWGTTASDTLAHRQGTCTNKANLLIALLRAAGIPAAYGVMRVNAREYFGAIGPPFLTRHASPESVHVYAAAYVGGRWVRCDPSTDAELADRTSHFCRQTRLIRWNGRDDAMDFLDPRHIYCDLGLYADIDELLARPARARTPTLLAAGNAYLEWVRASPRYASGEELICAYSAHVRAHRDAEERDRAADEARVGAASGLGGERSD